MTASRGVTSNNKDIRRLLKCAEQQRWRVEQGGKHIRWFSPDGTSIVVTSCTPGDHRAMLNIQRDLRKAGLKF